MQVWTIKTSFVMICLLLYIKGKLIRPDCTEIIVEAAVSNLNNNASNINTYTSFMMSPENRNGVAGSLNNEIIRQYSTSLGMSKNRVPFIGGNWKSYGTPTYVKQLVNLLNSNSSEEYKNIQVIIAPPDLFVDYVRNNLRPEIEVSTQDVSSNQDYGAFTGELCSKMIKDFGINWSIVGHSERRAGTFIPRESNDLVAKKTNSAIAKGLNVILCIGESLSDKEKGKTMEIIFEQLMPVKQYLNDNQWKNVVLAYEPVWAIGTGKSATPEIAQDAIKSIRNWLKDNISEEVASQIRILYGGSVNAQNANELITKEDIDGFLIGGASLKPEFLTIISSVSNFTNN